MARRDDLQQMLDADPDDLFIRYALALEDAKDGKPDEGIARLRDVIERDADYVAAYFQAGQLLAQQGQTTDAQQIVQQGIAAAQRTGDAHAAEEMSGFLEML